MKNTILEEQMELTLETRAIRALRNKRKANRPRAMWWFTQMRHVVDKAIERSPRPSAPAHQAYLMLDQRAANW